VPLPVLSIPHRHLTEFPDSPQAPVGGGGPAIIPLPPIPNPTGLAGAFAGIHGSHLLAGGGANFPDGIMPWDSGTKIWHDALYSLDLSMPGEAWKLAGKLPARNAYGVSLTTSGGILLIGGSNETEHLCGTVLTKIDTSGSPRFHELAQLPSPLAQMAGALVGSRVHICGGIISPDAQTAQANHWILDLDDLPQGWQPAPALPAAGRILATAAAVGDSFILSGGCALATGPDGKTSRTYLRDSWSFKEGAWSRLADLPRAAVAAASPAPVAGNCLYVVSGDDGSQSNLASPTEHRGFTPEILCYNSLKNQWTTAGILSVPPPVTLPTAPWQGGTIFFSGEIRPGIRSPGVFILTY
jgi:N-acetylneuraminic acid mutarotase